MLATPGVVTQRQQQCSPGRTGSRECDGHKRNTVAGHTGYTEQLPDSLDGKCNTTSLVQDRSNDLRLVLPILVRPAILFGRGFLLVVTLVLFSRRLSLRLSTYQFFEAVSDVFNAALRTGRIALFG